MDNPSPSSGKKKRANGCVASGSGKKKVKSFEVCAPAGEDDEESKKGIIEAGVKAEMKAEEEYGAGCGVVTAVEGSWPIKAEVVE
jgi:hypothetical protein